MKKNPQNSFLLRPDFRKSLTSGLPPRSSGLNGRSGNTSLEDYEVPGIPVGGGFFSHNCGGGADKDTKIHIEEALKSLATFCVFRCLFVCMASYVSLYRMPVCVCCSYMCVCVFVCLCRFICTFVCKYFVYLCVCLYVYVSLNLCM